MRSRRLRPRLAVREADAHAVDDPVRTRARPARFRRATVARPARNAIDDEHDARHDER